MQRRFLKIDSLRLGFDLVPLLECHATRGILPLLVLLLMVRAAMADSLPWGAQSIAQAGIPLSGVIQAVVSASGDIYVAGGAGSPTLTKMDATGHQIFAVQIPGISPQS